MTDPTIQPTPAELETFLAFEAEADRTFGEDSRAVRTIIGVCIARLRELAGPEATRTYLQKALEHIRRIDLLDVPPPAKRDS